MDISMNEQPRGTVGAAMLMIAASLLAGAPLLARQVQDAPRAATRTQPAPPGSQASTERIEKLPAALRERARLALAEPDEAKRGKLMEALIRADPAGTLDFALALIEDEASPVVRTEIFDELKKDMDPRVGPALERRVVHDPDPKIAIAALEVLRRRAERPLFDLLEGRIRDVRAAGDEAQMKVLAAEQERWTSMLRGGLLPTFMQQPPPPFSASPSGAPVRVLAFGDFGTGAPAQREVAAAMNAYHARKPFNFGLTLGDNFYSTGMSGPDDERWKTWWSDLYDPLKIQFYPTFGNHDWGQPNSPAAEIVFSQRSPSWRMPAAYYTFTAGDAQFFALDTDVISEKQLLWLDGALAASTARWKIVYGHHPIYSAGAHEDNSVKIAQLLPVLRGRADIYLAGHDHDMQHLKPEGQLHFFVAGTGGQLRTIQPGPRSLFAKSARGFAVLEIQTSSIVVSFVDVQGQELYRYQIDKEN
jgi:hypothetical protein